MAWTTTAGILSIYNEVLKEFYLPTIQDQLNHDNPMNDLIEVNTTDVSGKYALIETHYGRSTGRGVRLDTEALPDAGSQKYKTMKVPMQYIWGRIAVTVPTIAATRDESGSYVRALDSEIVGIVRDIKKEVNRMNWGCGYGVLGRWNSGTSTSIQLQKAYTGASGCGGTANLGAFGSTFGSKYATTKDGNTDLVCAVASGFSSEATKELTPGTTDLVVTGVTEGTYYDTITITDPGTPVAGSFFTRPLATRTPFSTYSQSSSYLTGARKEPMGLRGIVTDTDLDDIVFRDGTYADGGGTNYVDYLQGLAVGTYTWWKAHVDTHPSGRYAAQRPLTRRLMQKMFDKVERSAGKGYGPDLIIGTQALRAEYLVMMQDFQSFVNTMELDGGWTALNYNGVPFMVDPEDAIDGELYFLTTKDLARYRMSDYEWMQDDGAVLSRISGYGAYEAVLYCFQELGCKRRNSQGVICDLQYEAI